MSRADVRSLSPSRAVHLLRHDAVIKKLINASWLELPYNRRRSQNLSENKTAVCDRITAILRGYPDELPDDTQDFLVDLRARVGAYEGDDFEGRKYFKRQACFYCHKTATGYLKSKSICDDHRPAGKSGLNNAARLSATRMVKRASANQNDLSTPNVSWTVLVKQRENRRARELGYGKKLPFSEMKALFFEACLLDRKQSKVDRWWPHPAFVVARRDVIAELKREFGCKPRVSPHRLKCAIAEVRGGASISAAALQAGVNIRTLQRRLALHAN